MKKRLIEMLHRFSGKRTVSMVMIVAMLATSLPLQAFAVTVERAADGTFTITDDEGNITTVDESWEETFPYGTFAFSNTELAVGEGGEVMLTLYRLGGTEGRAMAFVEYNPTVTVGPNSAADPENPTPTFVYAAGWDDVALSVEDPSPEAQYQPIGAPQVHIKATDASLDVDVTRTVDDTRESPFGPVSEYGHTCYWLPSVQNADSYTWQVQTEMDGEWNDVQDYSENYLIVSNDLIYEACYDYRCVYTLDGETYCTDSAWGVEYVEEEATPLPERPADLVIPDEPTYTAIPETEDQFETYEKVGFWVTFADGEYQKTITLEALEDEIIEGDEFGTFTITDHEGASLYETANKCIVQLIDNEEHEETVLSFVAGETVFDRAAGTAVVEVTRTGDTTYPVSVTYTLGVDGDTAAAGTHYAAVSGSLYFYGDAATQKITIPLISAVEPDEAGKTVTVVLSDLRGGTDANLASLAADKLTLTLTCSGRPVGESVNLATLLSGGDGVEVSDIGEAEPVSVPLDPVSGQAQSQVVEELTAEIVWSDPTSRTYEYPNQLRFFRDVANYYSSYWADWENIINGDEFDISSIAGYGNLSSWEYQLAYEDKDEIPKGAEMRMVKEEGNIRMRTNSAAVAELEIENGERLFDRVELKFKHWAAVCGTHEKDRPLVIAPIASVHMTTYDADSGNSQEAMVKDIDWIWNDIFEYNKDGKKGAQYFNNTNWLANVSLDWKDRNRVNYGKINASNYGNDLYIDMFCVPLLWGQNLVNGKFKNESHAVMDDTANAMNMYDLDFGQLRRQKFVKDLNLTIYTANDADVLPDGTNYARLDADNDKYATNIYQAIKPVVSIVRGQGGVDLGGNIYVGSKLQVKLAAFGGYNAPDIGNGEYDYSVYLTNSKGENVVQGKYVGTETESGCKLYELELLWDEMTEVADKSTYLNDQYTLNIVMDRKQTITINLAPSMYDILEDGSIQPTTNVETAANYFLERHAKDDDGFIDIYHATADEDGTYYFKTGTDNKGQKKYYAKNDPSYKYPLEYTMDGSNMILDVETANLYSIRFDLPKEDKIAFNGRIYDGDETIYLQSQDLLLKNLMFYYYHEDCISVPSTMVATIDAAYLYLDKNANGMIDGEVDQNGTFVLNETKDQLITSFPGDKIADVDERYAEPVTLSDGTKASYILKVAYTMNPRKLEPMETEKDLTLTVQPAFSSAITDEDALATQTAEQKAVRYIEAGKTTIGGETVNSSINKPMFGAEATALQYVDIPLGGDHHPPYMEYENIKYGNDGKPTNEETEWGNIVYKWEPDYQGNLLTEYTSDTLKYVRPIILPNTVAGKNFPIATGKFKLVDNQITYDYGDDKATDLANMNGYLGSFVGTTTYSLVLLAPSQKNAEIIEEESVTMGNLKTHPNSEYLQNMQGSSSESAIDMGESGAEYPEFNTDFDSELGATNLNVNDYMTIIVDGYNVGFSIGIPLAGYHSNGDAGASGPGAGGSPPATTTPSRRERIKENMYGPGVANQARGTEIASMFNYFKDKANGTGGSLADVDDSYKAATRESLPAQPATATTEARPAQEPQYAAKGFGIELSTRLVMLFTWNPLDNGYYFSSMTVGITGSLVFTVMYRLSVCPILYCYLKIGAGLDVTTGIGVARSTKRADEAAKRVDIAVDANMKYSKNDPLVLEKGEYVVFQTPYRTFDITFDGALMVEVSEEFDSVSGNTEKEFVPLEKTTKGDDERDLRTGVISSAGSEAMTVVMVEKDGPTFHTADDDKEEAKGAQEYYVRLTAVEDTKVFDVYEVTDVRTKVYWTGISISPSAFLEVGVGAGVELMKIELFVSAGIGFSATLGAFNTKSEEYEGASFDKFEFNLGLSLRIVAIVFNFDFDLARYIVTYGDLGKADGSKGWQHSFKAGGGGYTTNEDLSKSISAGRTTTAPMVQITLPESSAGTQRFYGPDDGKNRAFGGGSSSEVPFQYSDYGSSLDVFKVAEGLTTRSDYQIVTMDNGEGQESDNYLVYTIGREGVASNSIHNTQLVLSKIKMVYNTTNGTYSYGLVNPVDETNIQTRYIPVDMVAVTTEPDPEPEPGTGTDTGTDPISKTTAETAPETPKLTPDTMGDVSFSAWVENGKIHVAWVNYGMPKTKNIPVLDQNATNEDKLDYQAAMAATTEIKTASFDPANAETVPNFTAAQVVSAGANGYTFLPDGAGDAVFFAESIPYTDEELTAANTAYSTYLSKAYATPNDSVATDEKDAIKYDNTAAAAYKGIRDFMLTNRRSENGLYGQGTTLHFWKDGVTLTDNTISLANGELLGNMEFAAGEETDTWLLAYTTDQRAYYNHATDKTVTDFTGVADSNLDEVRIQRLYIREVKLTETTTNGVTTAAVTWGDAKLLRILMDMDQNSTEDGRYSNGERIVTYTDPTFSNLRFLHAKLGNSLTGGEGLDTEPVQQARNGQANGSETFLLFDMMGSTYVLPKEDMEAILAGTLDEQINPVYDKNKEIIGYSGPQIFPFFVPETLKTDEGEDTNRTDNTGNTATGRMEVTIASDAQGRLAAVYTSPMEGTSNNGLYISWYDPESGTWGQGQLIAMHHMQVYEDAEKYDLDYDQKKNAYLGQSTGNAAYDDYLAAQDADSNVDMTKIRGSMSKFTFSDLQLALGRSTKANDDTSNAESTILIMTKGTMTELEETQHTINGKTETILGPTRDQKGVIEPSQAGFYGIVVGAGEPEITVLSMDFAEYGFNTGDFLQSYIRFKNTGDAAIRGSVAEPITVELLAKQSDSADSLKIAEWKITENILAGQEVRLMNEGDTSHKLAASLPEGTEFHLSVREYNETTNAGGTESTARTGEASGAPDNNPSNTDETFSFNTSSSLLTIEAKPELLFEKLEITPVGFDEDNNTILKIDAIVSNLGDANATDVYVQFKYQSGEEELGEGQTKDGAALMTEPVYTPVDLTKNNLKVSEMTSREKLARTWDKELANGKLYMQKYENGKYLDDTNAGKIAPNNYRSITGTFTVPPEYYYAADPAGALHLQFEIFSKETDTFQNARTGTVTSTHANEYQAENNIRTVDVPQQTRFQMPGQITIAMGNTMRIPVTALTSSGNGNPILVATELPVSDSSGQVPTNWEPNLGKLYYDVANDTVVVMPSKEGSGIIRLSDPQTNSIQDIAYVVGAETDGINIFNDNEMFTFSDTGWKFQSNIPANTVNTSDNSKTTPYRNDLAVADQDATVEFKTAAQSLTLTFDGDVKIEIFEESGSPLVHDKELSSDGLGQGRISWSNPTQKTYLVRITVKSNETRLDTVAEQFSNNVAPVPTVDPNKPQIFWSSNFPTAGSLMNETNVELTAYIVDDGALSSVMIRKNNGASEVPGSLESTTANLWSFPLTIAANGKYEIIATDANGNTTTETLNVNWFAGGTSEGATWSRPATPSVKFVDSNGLEIKESKNNPSPYYMKEVSEPSPTGTISAGQYIPNAAAFSTLSPKSDKPGTFEIGGNGIYRMTVTDKTGNWTSVIVPLTALPLDSVTLSLTQNQHNLYELEYSVVRGDDAPQTVNINGQEMLDEDGTTPKANGTLEIAYNGSYTLYAKFDDKDRGSGRYSIDVDKLQMRLKTDGVQPYTITNPWNQAENNGTLTLDPTSITGGYYQQEVLNSTGKYVGLYEYALVQTQNNAALTKEELTALLNTPSEWTTFEKSATVRTDLTPGFYTLYIRDSQEPAKATKSDGLLFYDFTLVGQRVLLASDVTSALTPGSKDGSIILTATGGMSGGSGYDYLCVPVPGSAEYTADEVNSVPLAALHTFGDELWVKNKQSPHTFTGLDEGWYQIAARVSNMNYLADGTGDWDNAETYAVYVHRRSSNATLQSLVTTPAFDGFYHADIFEYTLDVPYEVSSLYISYTLADANATDNDMNGEHPLVVGENVFEITVVAEDGVTTQTYTIIVNRDISDFEKYFPIVMESWNEDVARGYDWLELSKRIRRANHGRTFVVDPLSDAFVATDDTMDMPGYVLDAMADATVTLRLKAGDGVNWILHSDDVAYDTDNRGFRLEANLGTGVISAAAIQAVAGDLWSTQLTIRYTGTTDVVTNLETDLGTSQAGKSARLYHRDDAGDLVYLTETTVDGKGLAIWTMPEHIGGTYLIVTGALPESPTVTPTLPEASPLYDDVTAADWFADAVDYVTANGLMNGMDNDSFGPAGTVSRAMLLTVLHRLEGAPAPNGSISFTDVADGTWYTQAIHWAAETGILTGYGNGQAGTNDPVTREQIAVFLHRYALHKQNRVQGNYTLNGYTDGTAASDWAAEALGWAVGMGLITGRTTDTISPTGTATRAELATILMRYCTEYGH